MREPSFEWEAFVIKRELFTRWVPDWKGFRREPKSLVGVGNIGKCCEGFVGI